MRKKRSNQGLTPFANTNNINEGWRHFARQTDYTYLLGGTKEENAYFFAMNMQDAILVMPSYSYSVPTVGVLSNSKYPVFFNRGLQTLNIFAMI